MLDPALYSLLAVAFAVLFVTAAWHKLSHWQEFLGVLDDYQLLPRGLLPLGASLLAVVEIGLGLAWASAWNTELTVLASLSLMSLYALAMAINLLRGRHYIDCGCSFASSRQDAASGQAIGWGLVLRNLLLGALSTLALLPITLRPLAWLDYAVIAMGLVTLVLLYGAGNQLMANRSAIQTWRHPNRGDANA